MGRLRLLHPPSIGTTDRAEPRRATVEFDVKTRTSRRCVDLDPVTITELDRWRRRLRVDDLPQGPDDWMFCNRRGRFLNPESFSQLFDRVVQRADVPRIRFHDLRHTHASLLVANGVPIKVVTERVGHAHSGFTIHTYQHLVPGMSAAAAEGFAILGAAASRYTSTGSSSTFDQVSGHHLDRAGRHRR